MSEDFIRNVLLQARGRLDGAATVSELLTNASAFIGQMLGCDRVTTHLVREAENVVGEWRADQNEHGTLRPLFDLREIASGQLEVPTLYVHDIKRSALSFSLLDRLQAAQVLSLGTVPLVREGASRGWIEIHFTRGYYRWRREDAVLLTQLADYVVLFIELTQRREIDARNEARAESIKYERLAEYGNLIIIRTDAQFRVESVIGNTVKLLGVPHKELLRDPQVWARVLHPFDLRRLQIKILRLKTLHFQINEEVRVVTPSGYRWLLLKGVPITSATNEFLGWEGFGIDITEQREVEDSLVAERRRVEALYEVSRALQSVHETPVVVQKGLLALVSATASEAGFGCLYEGGTKKIDIVAYDGLSAPFLEGTAAVLAGAGLVRVAIESGESILIPDIQQEPRAALELVSSEGLHSTLIVPVKFESQVLGALVLYRRKGVEYSRPDLELVAAAASQIGLALHQAEHAAQERRHIQAISALYELSHEVSKHLTAREVAEHAFPLLSKELICKRMWLGVLNDQGTHIVGQAGFGPGVRGGVVSVQVELSLRHDHFDEALKTKQPVIVEAGAVGECSGLTRIVEKLELGTYIIAPLVCVGTVVGVLVVEPAMPTLFFAQKKLALLNSMANEIASVIMARRYEGKMAEANKMRMATLLASGVAHNFNNLLQAIMGQASLLEMQLPPESPLSGSARMVMAAAERGAALIRQLLSFTTNSEFEMKPCAVGKLLRDSVDLYRSIVGRNVSLQLQVDESLPAALADERQMQQVVTNLLVNAKEALASREQGEVKISATAVRVRSGEVDPDLAPGMYVRIDIEDNGVGMDRERQSRCFEPFYTTKINDSATGVGFGSAGLGLSSAYAMVKNHEGVITVSSEVGDGATFSVYLPVRDGVGAGETLHIEKIAEAGSTASYVNGNGAGHGLDADSSAASAMRPLHEEGVK